MMQIVKGETTGKNGANMTNRVILPLQDSVAICVIKKNKLMLVCTSATTLEERQEYLFVERLCSWNCRFRFGNLGSLLL